MSGNSLYVLVTHLPESCPYVSVLMLPCARLICFELGELKSHSDAPCHIHIHIHNDAGLLFSRRRQGCMLCFVPVDLWLCWAISVHIRQTIVSVDCFVNVAEWIFGLYLIWMLVFCHYIFLLFTIWCAFESHTWCSKYILWNTAVCVAPEFCELQSNLPVVFAFIVYVAYSCWLIYICVYCRCENVFQHI